MRSSLRWLVTPDGWRLGLHRFAPSVGGHPWPVLCLHGFSQNYRTWLQGGFVQGLLAQGLTVYLLDFRGHGYSRGAWQTRPGPVLPEDWTIEDYLHRDLPPAIDAIRSAEASASVILCGHSLGGLLSLAYALRKPDHVAALATLAAPVFPDRALARLRWFCRAFQHLLALADKAGLAWRSIRMDRIFASLDSLYHGRIPLLGGLQPFLPTIDPAQWLARLWHPESTSAHVIRPLLQDAQAEPFGVVERLLSWFAEGEISLDFEEDGTPPSPLAWKLPTLRHPLLVACGEEDLLATPTMNLALVEAVGSAWKRWLPLSKTNHIDIVAGKPAQSVLLAFADLLAWLRRSGTL